MRRDSRLFLRVMSGALEAKPTVNYLSHVSTPLGVVGLEWSGQGLWRILLGKEDLPSVRESPYPTWLEDLIPLIQMHLSGTIVNYEQTPLLGVVTPFSQRVREACRLIPVGKTMTYGELAAQVGSPGAAQAVGQVMKRNPFPLIIPCHRVVGAGSNRWHYSAGGAKMKKALLAMESETSLFL